MKRSRILCVLMSLVVSITSLSSCMELFAEGVHETVAYSGYTEHVESTGTSALISRDPDTSKHKIFENVWAAEPNAEGKRLVAVFLQPLNGDTVNDTVKERYGVDLTPYMDAALYETTVYPYLEAELKRVMQERYNVIVPREEMLKTIRATTAEEAEAEDRANYEKYKKKLDGEISFGVCRWYPTILLLDLGFALEEPVWGDFNVFSMALSPEEKALLEEQYWVVSISEHSDEISSYDPDTGEYVTTPMEPRPDGKKMYSVFCSGFGAIKRTHDEAIEYYLHAMYGYDADVYENEARYAAEYRPALAKIAAQNAQKPAEESGRTKIPYDRIGMTPWQEDENVYEMSVVQRKDRDEITALRLLTVSELCAEQASDFLSDMEVDAADVYEVDKYTATVFLWVTEDELLRYAACEQVAAIGLWEPDRVVEAAMEDEMAVTKGATASVTNTVASTDAVFPATIYTGVAVKVGVIEAPVQLGNLTYGRRFDPNAPQISSDRFTFVPNMKDGALLVTSVVDDHATAVVSVLAGKSKQVNGKSYYGVASGAEVYQTNYITEEHFKNALTILADQGVSLINASVGGLPDDGYYSTLAQHLDWFIRNTWISVVVSAGNNSVTVMSPGHAYNAITVGNAVTISDTGYMLTAPYAISVHSNYADQDMFANKPDIVAPGTQIGVVLDNGEVTRVSGTSYAAPVVTGVLAQMIQAGSAWVYHIPETLKAALLVTADPTRIADPSDEACEGTSWVKDKSGAGMVDALAATNFMVLSRDQAFITMLDDLPRPITLRYTVELQAGDLLRCAMVYENVTTYPNTEMNVINLDLALISPTQAEVASSHSPYNNVEMLEYTAVQAGVYTIEVSYVSYVYPSERLLYVGTAYTVE